MDKSIDSNVRCAEYTPESRSIDTSYKMVRSKHTDSLTVFNNPCFQIISVSHDSDVGELIGVYNKVTQKSFSIDQGDSYYDQVVDSLLIVDSGTSASSRGLSVYNLNIPKEVFYSDYTGEYTLEGDLLKFKKAVELPKSKRPKCPDGYNPNKDPGLGYVENQILNLRTLTLEKTGQYECFIFE